MFLSGGEKMPERKLKELMDLPADVGPSLLHSTRF